MATNLKQGSSGSDVKKLQQTLIEKGYDVGGTGADGVFGKNTLAAVKQYQKDNGLAVDGIAGKNTLGSLYSTGNNNANNANNNAKGAGNGAKGADPVADKPVAPVTPTDTSIGEPPAPTVTNPTAYGGMTEEDIANYKALIGEASSVLQQAISNKPGAYQNGADYGIAQDYLSQYQNRGDFSYDFNSDALYNQYKDQYIQQGQMAMMDTMGQAATMTGGYGNSYAQTVGQQEYNQYLGQLNEVMPELYGMAYDRYNQEGQELLNMYDLYMNREQDNYNKYLDSVNLWNNEVAQARDNYTSLYNEFTGAYDQTYLEDENERKWEYTEKQDAKSYLIDLITSTGYNPSDEELAAAGMTSAEAKALKNAYTTSTSSNTGNGSNGSDNTKKYLSLEGGSEAYNALRKEIKDATTYSQLQNIAKVWAAMGYDPDAIAAMTAEKEKELRPNSGSSGSSSSGSGGIGSTGGGGGGTSYWEQW